MRLTLSIVVAAVCVLCLAARPGPMRPIVRRYAARRRQCVLPLRTRRARVLRFARVARRALAREPAGGRRRAGGGWVAGWLRMS